MVNNNNEIDSLKTKLMQTEKLLEVLRYEYEKISQFLNSIFFSIHDLFFIVSKDGTINTINKQAEKLLGYQESDLLFEDFSVLFENDNRLKDINVIIKTLTDHNITDLDTHCFCKSGQSIPVLLSASLLLNPDCEVMGVIFIAKDTRESRIIRELKLKSDLLKTQKREIEEKKKSAEHMNEWLERQVRVRTEELENATDVALSASRAKSEFLANMSHEIRTPMNGIMGLTQLALKTDLSVQQKDYLTKIDSSAKSLLNIINDILDFSKIEAGKLDVESTKFDIHEVLDKVIQTIAFKAHEKGLEFLLDCPMAFPCGFIGDPLRLQQILLNLVTNAIKFTESGHVIISVRLLEFHSRTVNVFFSVMDTGIGITDENKQHLFKSFNQADTSTTRQFGGTGLGLAITKHLVELMGGGIEVHSEYGKGSTFSFTLNFKRTEQQPDPVPLSPSLIGMPVLIVDDNEVARDVISEILRSLQFHVKSVSSGEKALQELERKNSSDFYKLVILDGEMPGLDGIETAKKISDSQKFGNTRLVLMTTTGNRDEKLLPAEGAKISYITRATFNTVVQLNDNLK